VCWIPRKFDMNAIKICPSHLSDVATLSWEIQKSHFLALLFIHASGYLCYLRRKQTVIYLPTHLKVTTLTCELLNFFIRLKVRCVLQNAGGSEKNQLWVIISGSKKNRLWCVATGMSGKQCHSKCSEWPPSALIHASSIFRHWSVA